MAKPALKLTISADIYSIHRLDPASSIPDEVKQSETYFIGKTKEELSIVCNSNLSLESSRSVKGWSYIKVMGPLDFNLQGVISGISGILAQAGITICVISTFDTDYVFVRVSDLDRAETALEKAGYEFDQSIAL